MSEMVDRVGRAIHWAEGKGGDRSSSEYWHAVAKAVIKAMREPTEAMLGAGPPEPYMDAKVWGRMIDAALK